MEPNKIMKDLPQVFLENREELMNALIKVFPNSKDVIECQFKENFYSLSEWKYFLANIDSFELLPTREMETKDLTIDNQHFSKLIAKYNSCGRNEDLFLSDHTSIDDPVTIQHYRNNMYQVIDGLHRYTLHKLERKETMKVAEWKALFNKTKAKEEFKTLLKNILQKEGYTLGMLS